MTPRPVILRTKSIELKARTSRGRQAAVLLRSTDGRTRALPRDTIDAVRQALVDGADPCALAPAGFICEPR